MIQQTASINILLLGLYGRPTAYLQEEEVKQQLLLDNTDLLKAQVSLCCHILLMLLPAYLQEQVTTAQTHSGLRHTHLCRIYVMS